MPKKCCVIGCKSGYDTNKEKVNTFKFPNEENLKMKWLVAIGRKDYKPSKWASVCHKHFQKDDIIRHCVGVDPETGAEALFPVRVKLKEGAIPLLNLNNSKNNTKQGQKEGKIARKTRGPGRPRKTPKVESKSSSSDEDIPLEALKNQCSASKTDSISNNSDAELPAHSGNLKQRFFDLLHQYEQLKERHVSLGQEIEVLEKVNVELKCKLFKF